MLARIREFVRCETGQDLVEYALLVVFIALASVATWRLIETALGTAYAGYVDPNTGVQSLWEPCDPGGC